MARNTNKHVTQWVANYEVLDAAGDLLCCQERTFDTDDEQKIRNVLEAKGNKIGSIITFKKC